MMNLSHSETVKHRMAEGHPRRFTAAATAVALVPLNELDDKNSGADSSEEEASVVAL